MNITDEDRFGIAVTVSPDVVVVGGTTDVTVTCTISRAGSTATMLAGHTAVSAGLSPPHACKQPSWELQLAHMLTLLNAGRILGRQAR